MKTCECGGELLRHGARKYKTTDMWRVRYICRECRKSFTQKMDVSKVMTGKFLHFNSTGRPTYKDWRYL